MSRKPNLKEVGNVAGPLDANQGGGYGRAGKARGLGSEYTTASDFPYYEKSEVPEEDDVDDLPASEKLSTFRYTTHDPAGAFASADRWSASSARIGVSESGIVPIPDLYDNMDGGSPVGGTGTLSRITPFVGSKRGAAGYNPLAIDDEMENFSIYDIINDDDTKSLERSKKIHSDMVKEYRRFVLSL